MLPIDFQWIHECESTSRLLKEQGWADIARARVLAAERQSAGMGRLGREWISLSGNLHFSIAIPEAYISEDLKDVIPLAAGVLVAEFLRFESGLNICLKWPNDLILDGRKIGGILCESSILDARMQGVIIGIGINLGRAPDISHESSYPTGYLTTCSLTRSWDAPAMAKSLAEWFASKWLTNSKADVLERWKFFAISAGHSWYRKTSEAIEWYRVVGADSQGYFCFRASAGGPTLTVNSISHDLRWDVLMRRKILVADVGNTRTKVGTVVIHQDGSIAVEAMASDAEGVEPFVIKQLEAGVAPVVHCISVNPLGFKALDERLQGLSVTLRQVEKKPVRLTNSKYDFTSLGADRWALLELLLYRQSMGELRWPAIIVSAGTATTIDCIDASGCHVGGYILAGIQTSIEALSGRGALLPKSLDVQSSRAVEGWPTTSQDAMIEAAIYSTTAVVQSERSRLAQLAGVPTSNVSVLLTGGFAKLIGSRLNDHSMLLDEQLVLCGAGVLVANGR